jgi:hypothetical protein
MMRGVRQSTLSVVASIALLLSACSNLAPQGSLRTYYRNPAGHALGVQVESTMLGPVGWTRLGDGLGCSAVSVPWAVTIGAAGRDGAVGNYAGLLSSADVADPTNAEIWIDVAEDGSVRWGEGKPDWAPEDAPSCLPGG